MAVRIRDEFFTDSGRNYRTEIHDTAWAGAITTDLESIKLEFDWNGNESDLLEPIKPSTCNFTLLDDGSGDFQAFRADIASASEAQFQLVVYLKNGASWDLYWCGVIMTDMVQWRNEYQPREFEILAKDGLNRLEEIRFDELNASPFTTAEQTFMYIIKTILSKNNLQSFYTGDYIKVSIDWNEVSQTLSVPQRVLEYVSIWGDLMKEQPKSDADEKQNDLEPFNCKRILEGLLRLFCARIIQSNGAFHIQQVSNFTADTYTEADYDNTGAYVTNQSVTVKKSAAPSTDFAPINGGIYGYIAALRSSRLTAKGYMDIRGAYVDEAIVDEANRVYTQTMKLGNILGGGQSYATATILAADNNSGQDIVLIAEKIGAGGNSISFTSAVSTDPLFKQINTYNSSNPTTRFKLADPTKSGVLITTSRTYAFSGGVTGTGQASRQLEIDFELTIGSQISDAMASNMQIRIDVKLICGSYRIKNSQANDIDAEWSTTATDKWSYLVKGNDYRPHKIAIITPEIPFESENNCTLELTVTLQRNSTAVAFPSANDYYGIFHDFRIIAWDGGRTKLGDQVVRVENPTVSGNSIEYDFGMLFIGDDPIVQSSISSKNYLLVNDGTGVYYRSNVWDAGYDTDYNLSTTLLMEAIALRKTPVEKYIGGFVGDYEAYKSIGYDSARWVMSNVRYDAKMDEWNGVWWKINYSRADITLSEQRLLPPPISLSPYKKPLIIKNDLPDKSSKGTNVYPYIQGQGAVNAFDVDALDNDLFRQGDSMQVYHPTKAELLDTFVVDSDTTISDTTIDVVSKDAASEIPFGALLEHDPKEVVASNMVRAKKFVQFGAIYRKALFLVAGDYSVGGGFYYYNLDNTANLVLVDLSADLVNTYRTYLPEISTCFQNGQSIVVTIKGRNGSHAIFPHPDDTAAGANIITTSAVSSLNVSGGNQRSFITDGTDWHTIGF